MITHSLSTTPPPPHTLQLHTVNSHTQRTPPPHTQIPWYDHAKFEYYASPQALFGVQMLLFAWVEMRRLQDIRKPGSAGQDPIFSQYRWGREPICGTATHNQRLPACLPEARARNTSATSNITAPTSLPRPPPSCRHKS